MTETIELTPRRNRSATELRIIEAARAVLAEEGFQNFGINAIARRAGCDKQLIYRYFGGLDGLADTLGEALAGWLEDRLDTQERSPTYAALIERLVIGYMEALRADPLVQRIVAWELSDTSPHVVRLSEARSRALQTWVLAARGELRPPEGIDAPALNALIIGAVQQLVLGASGPGQFAGLALTAETDWERVRQAVRRLVRTAYGSGNPQD